MQHSFPLTLWLFVCLAGCNKTPSFMLELLEWPRYDKRLPPEKSKNFTAPTLVTADIYIEGMSSLEESSMDYQVDFYLRLYWTDPRLSYSENVSQFIDTNDETIQNSLWWPDLYIANAKKANFMYITVPNIHMRFFPDGSIYTSRRIQATLSCNMKLNRFPADSQRCWIKFVTYMSIVQDVNILWKDGENSIDIDKNVDLPDYEIVDNYTKYCDGRYASGTFSCLKAIFEIERYSGFHFFQTYIPSTFIVVMSWIGFWITPRAVPARVTLSITTFLALTTQSQGVKVALPAVSYATAVDIWSTICTIFVFAALLEFAVAYHLWEKEAAGNRARFADDDDDGATWAEKRKIKVAPAQQNIQPDSKKETPRLEKTTTQQRILIDKVLAKWKINDMKSSRVDRMSRIIFPLAFVVCNGFYWAMYPPNFNMNTSTVFSWM